jgi:membrane dipeptidase
MMHGHGPPGTRPAQPGGRRAAALARAAGVLALTAGLGGAAGDGTPAPSARDALRARAHRLHHEAIILDTHADLTPFLEMDTMPARITDPAMAGPAYDPRTDPRHEAVVEKWKQGFPAAPWRFADRHADGYMDLPRMREGGLDAEFFAVYMEREARPGMAVKRTLGQIDAIRAICEKYPRDIALATTAAEVRGIVGSGRVAALIGLEGGHMIEDDLRVLRMFHALGVRYMTLTHAFHVNWADSSTGSPRPLHGGLSPFGRAVVQEMNRLGMMVDISHVSDKTFFDALEVSRAPVIASHSSVDAVREHPRNMSDEMLRALAANGGVIQVDAVVRHIDAKAPSAGGPPWVQEERTPMSVFIDHIVHAVKVAGPDHVGIGIDYGYGYPTPVGMEDCSKLENVTYELLARGLDEATVRKIWGENTLRVMAEAERVAARLKLEERPAASGARRESPGGLPRADS